LPWATPEALGRLTLVQLVCLGTEDAPDRAGRKARTADDFRRLMAEASREEEEWGDDG
jgi:hypothetical protein